jgi:hypothetical protein
MYVDKRQKADKVIGQTYRHPKGDRHIDRKEKKNWLKESNYD